MNKRHRKALILTAKLVIAAGLLVWLLSKVRLHDYPVKMEDGTQRMAPGFLTIVAGIDWPILALGALGFLISLIIIALRLWMLLRIQRIRIPLWESIRLTFLGQFFNNVVPGMVGGDLVKAYYIGKHTPKKAAVLVSVFVDRLMGLAELTLLAAAMLGVVLLFDLEDWRKVRLAGWCVLLAFVLTAGLLVFLLSRRFRRALHLQRLYQKLPMAHHIAAAGDAALLYRKRIGVLFRAVAMTIGAHAFWVGGHALIGLSVSLSVPWYSYFVYVPLIYILGAVPLTPGGVGVVEYFFFLFFAQSGGVAQLEAEQAAFALALLSRFMRIFWGLPGAIVAVRGAQLPKTETMQAELGIAD